MARREIKWTLRALKDKMAIYEYWINKNKSVAYPQKLERLFNEIMTLTVSFPHSGQQTEFENIRIRIVKHYKLVYQITDSAIIVLTVWDIRQHPKNLKIK